jgi:hypothetical protein
MQRKERRCKGGKIAGIYVCMHTHVSLLELSNLFVVDWKNENRLRRKIAPSSLSPLLISQLHKH